MRNFIQHIISLCSSLSGFEQGGCMFREGRPSEPIRYSGDMEV